VWICWLTGAESESTGTIALTELKTGVFLDVSLLKRPPKGGNPTAEETSEELDWAFSDYCISNGANIKFIHRVGSIALVCSRLGN
jgi:hypothetical protein